MSLYNAKKKFQTPAIIVVGSRSLENNVYQRRVSIANGDGTNSSVFWNLTHESNGYMLWRTRCLDTKPWEESEWESTAINLFRSFDKNDAIEACVLLAQEENEREAQKVPNAKEER